jgi:hypothetical protein
MEVTSDEKRASFNVTFISAISWQQFRQRNVSVFDFLIWNFILIFQKIE